MAAHIPYSTWLHSRYMPSMPQPELRDAPPPTLCTFHPPPRLPWWLIESASAGGDDVTSSLSVCPSLFPTPCLSCSSCLPSVCLKPVSRLVFSINPLLFLSGWLRARLPVWITTSPSVIERWSNPPTVFFPPVSLSLSGGLVLLPSSCIRETVLWCLLLFSLQMCCDCCLLGKAHQDQGLPCDHSLNVGYQCGLVSRACCVDGAPDNQTTPTEQPESEGGWKCSRHRLITFLFLNKETSLEMRTDFGRFHCSKYCTDAIKKASLVMSNMTIHCPLL